MARSEVVRFNRLIFGKVRVELLYFSWYGNVQMNQFQQRSNFQPEMWNPKNICILFFEVTSLSLSSFLPLSLSRTHAHMHTHRLTLLLEPTHAYTHLHTHTHTSSRTKSLTTYMCWYFAQSWAFFALPLQFFRPKNQRMKQRLMSLRFKRCWSFMLRPYGQKSDGIKAPLIL